jgi:integrase
VWEDIDLDAGVIHVRQARVHTPEGVAIGELKTGKSEGDVAIPIHVVEALRTHRTRQAEEKMRHRDVYADDGLVFATRLGTPIDRWSLRRSFGDLTEQAGLGRLHPTILRHTFTSRMLDADVPTEKVRAALRHSPGSRTLERHYSHQVRPTVGEATRRAIEERYGTANKHSHRVPTAAPDGAVGGRFATDNR